MSAALALSFVGCAGSPEEPLQRVAVAGRVTLDDHPLPQGVIRFIPAAGNSGPKTSAEIDNGAFSLPAELGPVVGQHRVEIESTDTSGLAMDDEQALERLNQQRPRQPLKVLVLPPIYNEQSQLTATIPETGDLELEFKLSSRRP